MNDRLDKVRSIGWMLFDYQAADCVSCTILQVLAAEDTTTDGELIKVTITSSAQGINPTIESPLPFRVFLHTHYLPPFQ